MPRRDGSRGDPAGSGPPPRVHPEPDPGTPRRRDPPLRRLVWIPALIATTLLAATWAVLRVVLPEDERDLSTLIADLRRGDATSRQRDARFLAQRIAEAEARRGGRRIELDLHETGALRDMLLDPEADVFTRSYVSLALGRAGAPDVAVPALASLVTGDGAGGTGDALRAHAVQGLGLSRVEAAIAPLLEALRAESGEARWEMRLYAIGAIANVRLAVGRLRDEETVRTRLRECVQDPAPPVAWNAAAILAREFGDREGEAVLRRLLPRAGEAAGDAASMAPMAPMAPEARDRWACLALDALHALHGADLEPLAGEVAAEARRRGWRRTLRRAIAITEPSSPAADGGL